LVTSGGHLVSTTGQNVGSTLVVVGAGWVSSVRDLSVVWAECSVLEYSPPLSPAARAA
jgi:hypothetical protein